MLHISKLTKEAIKEIKLIVFDVDGVLVPRGTKIKQEGNTTTLETKRIHEKQIEQIKKLYELGYYVDINSGRGLYMLQEMFREVMPFVSLTYENGSCSWYKGKLYQHVNSYEHLRHVLPKLQKVKHANIKGFEPKEFIITIHAHDRVPQIEEIMKTEDELYCIWNGEAYDIGIKEIQTKAIGLRNMMDVHNLKKENVLAIGDNYNDKEMMDCAGISVTADKTRVEGTYYVELNGEKLPADVMMTQILKVNGVKI